MNLPAFRAHLMGGALLAVAVSAVPVFHPTIARAEPAAAAEQLAQSTVETLPAIEVTGTVEPSLTLPGTEAARANIQLVPGGVDLVADDEWKDGASTTLKDVLEYTPGVFIQPKWGEDSRLSIRGSGLSRNFHLRGIQLYQDGIPMSAADGASDFQELDPTAYRYVEVYKGANGLRYGANSFGGAINFVTPTGYDAALAEGRVDIGSFGFRRLQASSGANVDGFDGFVTDSIQSHDGYRDHSGGVSKRASGNIGWRISDTVETRFYLNVSDIQQDIPGSVTKDAALNNPRAATANNIAQGYQRNMETVRFANKTTLDLDSMLVDLGAYASNKELIHPIFQYLDYTYNDFGGFARATHTGSLFGHGNRLTVGANIFGGWVDNEQYANNGGNRGALLSASTDSSLNLIGYAENSFDITTDLSLITGLQLVHASRERDDEFLDATDTSGKNTYNFANPKVGLLWYVDPDWQVFGNISKSSEAPTFGELNFTNAVLSDTEAQEAVTFEIGTRGARDDLRWDVALYRAHLENEFQFFDLGGGRYSVTNADDTIHQGLELGLGWAPVKNLFTDEGEDADRLWLNLAYTYSDFSFDDDPVWGDNDLPGAPSHFLRAELLYESPLGFYAGPNVEWVPDAYYVDNANTQETRPYALLGFRAGYDFNENISLFLDARNLTDQAYISSVGIAGVANSASMLYEPGTGRAVYAGLRLRW